MDTQSHKIVLGISVGDANGVGIEVLLKTFADKRMFEFCTPVVFGSIKLLAAQRKHFQIEVPLQKTQLNRLEDGKLNVVECLSENELQLDYGVPNQWSGKVAFESFSKAVAALKENKIDGLLTAPISKENIYSDEFQFAGHTEFLDANLTGEALMILMSDQLKLGLVTGHIPLAEVANVVTKELIVEKVAIMNKTLVQDFGIRKPKIAILGLNPHCGDSGVIGKEDQEIVTPAVEMLNQKNILAFGPYAADGFFGSQAYSNFDGVISLYHDQGLVGFKTVAFGGGVNFTAGLSGVGLHLITEQPSDCWKREGQSRIF